MHDEHQSCQHDHIDATLNWVLIGQWPTIIPLVMFPILVVMYLRLARGKERNARLEFGEAYARREADTPAFFPGFGVTVHA